MLANKQLLKVKKLGKRIKLKMYTTIRPVVMYATEIANIQREEVQLNIFEGKIIRTIMDLKLIRVEKPFVLERLRHLELDRMAIYFEARKTHQA